MITLNSLLAVSTGAWVGILVACIVVFASIGATIGYLIYKKHVEKQIGTAKSAAEKILKDAETEGKNIRKEAIIEAKEQEIKMRNDFERERNEKRQELAKSERRLEQKEEALDKKEEALDRKNDALDGQIKSLQAKEQQLALKEKEVAGQHDAMIKELEKVAGYTRDEAKQELVNNMTEDAKKEALTTLKTIEAQTKEDADKKAKDIISLAIQRCAAEQASEITVSVVPIPSDDMKARIIGREGRNIRTLENACGIELIIDDTPEVVIVSGFDPVRRETARIALEKLIADGRIHPARIEETVEKVKKELDVEIKEAGEAAMLDCGLFNIHPELIKLLGRLKFRTSYGQNVLKHSIEVSRIAGIMANELGMDGTLAKRAGLLHDIGKAVDFEVEGTHIQIGTDLAKKYKENQIIVNAIQAHHGDVEPQSIEAVLVQAADAISGARPGARRETTTNYVKRLQRLEELANEFKGVDKSYAIQAGREIRVLVKPDKVDDNQTYYLAKDIAKKIEDELDYPRQIKVNVIRELRATEYAK